MTTRFFDDVIRDERKGPAVGLLKFFLWILSLFYGCGVRIRNMGYAAGILPQRKLPKPVISVGNMTVGGSGKTPLVIWLVRRLAAEGYKPAILTRGYQARNQEEGNDEVQMMRDMCPDVPIIVGKDRYETAMQFLFGHEVDVFVMDDGFQHRMLARDLDIIAVESLRGFGNGHMLPRGILREPLSGLARADVIVLTKLDVNPGGEAVILDQLRRRKKTQPVIRSRQRVTGLVHLRNQTRQDVHWLRDLEMIAVSSIADPKSFEETLRQNGARIKDCLFYPDHCLYQSEDIQRIAGAARDKAVKTIVTTQKDAVKFRELLDVIPQELDIWILNVELDVEDNENIFGQRISHLLRA